MQSINSFVTNDILTWIDSNVLQLSYLKYGPPREVIVFLHSFHKMYYIIDFVDTIESYWLE